MFEKDVQDIVDKYLADEITEAEFLQSSRPWPKYNEFYRPLLELAKKNKCPVIAANIPRKYAAQYTREGMTGINQLPPDERALVADKLVIRDDKYLQEFYKTMMLNMGVDTNEILTPNQENTLYLYYGAQVLKDETMGESIADFIAENEDYKVIHFNGNFHSNEYLGTVEKLKDRNNRINIGIITPDYIEKEESFKFTQDFIGKTDFLLQLINFQREEINMQMMGGHLGENYVASHKIRVELFPDKQSLKGTDYIGFANPILRQSSLTILKDLNIISIKSEEGGLDFEIVPSADGDKYRDIIIKRTENEIKNVEINYEGVVYNSPNELSLNQRHSNSVGIISDKEGEGIYLPNGSYYPSSEGDMADFDIEVTVPSGITIVTSGKLESVIESDNKRTFKYVSEVKADNFIIVGGRYIVADTTHDGKIFRTYTFSDSKSAKSYLDASIEYYDLYTKLLGPYPYSNFSIVENFFATGFGMPGYTLLSNKLMAMPWIVLMPGSLAHEFVHNWWGNSVYTSYKKGNWCEALTSFCTNYYYNVLKNDETGAIDWRKKALISIAALPDEANYPVADFKYQSNNDDAVIGYQKGGFIFYEISKLMGDESFFNGLKAFAQKYQGKRATWFSLKYTLAGQARKDNISHNITEIMDTWLNAKDVPTLKLEYISFDGDSLRFNINQDGKFTSVVPVEITTDKGIETMNCTITEGKNRFGFKPDGELKSIQVDKKYQALRKLNKWEVPYSFNQTLNSEPFAILPSKKSSDYKTAEQLAKMMIEGEYKIEYKSIDDLVDDDWKNRSIIIIGNSDNNKFFNQVMGKYPTGTNISAKDITLEDKNYNYQGNILLLNMGHPTNPDKFASIIYTDKMEDIAPLKRLFRYLSYSMVFLNRDQVGRPLKTMEIFPEQTDNSALFYKFEKMYR